jgi:S-adenosylmethionine/arginine decarboxylase-like enzyme
MPAFLLPYYDGIVAEDCGISAFVFLRGGHFTLHTFSFREAYFVDLCTPHPFNRRQLQVLLEGAFPGRTTMVNTVIRRPGAGDIVPLNKDLDFGPHLMLDIVDYRGPQSLDDLFDLFDVLPQEAGMVPIMRPYVMKTTTTDGRRVVSAMTLVAESHLSLHVFPEEKRAYFDVFACRFFAAQTMIERIKARLPGRVVNEILMGRAHRYKLLRTERPDEISRTRRWVRAVEGLATNESVQKG